MLASAAFAFSGNDLVAKFNSWKKQHGKEYKAEEESARLATFISNDALIASHNAANWTFTLGHNKFSDLTFEEFQRDYMADGLALFTNKPKTDRVFLKGEHAPQGYKAADAVDWVSKGAVTPVKDQGRCGSCWSFSTTGSIEGSYQINTGKLASFSEEMLVQCDNRANGGEDQGCNGGLMDNAFEWIEKNNLCTEDSYPYTSGTGTTGTCKKTCTPSVTVTGFTDVTKGDEDALADAVAKQPVSIAVDAQGSQWQLYKSGIFNHPTCGKQLDHGVLLVGYGSDSMDYWKIKNSWGTTWGEEGYMRMKKGSNMCGLANSASYPNAKAVGPTPPGPSPGPSPSPPSPSPPSSSHYEDPSGGCMSDEVAVQIQGITGDFCSPKCSLFKKCPTDVPTGVTATPQCALKDSASNSKYCALICSASLPILDQKAADAQCGANASCKSAGVGVGLCTYDD